VNLMLNVMQSSHATFRILFMFVYKRSLGPNRFMGKVSNLLVALAKMPDFKKISSMIICIFLRKRFNTVTKLHSLDYLH